MSQPIPPLCVVGGDGSWIKQPLSGDAQIDCGSAWLSRLRLPTPPKAPRPSGSYVTLDDSESTIWAGGFRRENQVLSGVQIALALGFCT